MTYNIAIDGPAGAGKSTIARQVARTLGYIYVYTGAMYRAMALHILKQGIDPKDADAVAQACKGADIDIRYEKGEQQIILNGENVTGELRREEVGNTASQTSVYGCVREKLTQLQKELAGRENVVMDGRDIGTSVLPDAQAKIYLTASSRTRAERRCLELRQKGIEGNVDEIEADINERDYRDMHREISPLRQAADAHLVDSSEMTIDEVTDAILLICRNAGCR